MSNLDVKKQSVAEITENFKGAESAVVVDYRGLDVAEITALRKELRDNNVTYKVYKNTMVKRAVADDELEGLNDILDGPTVIAFGHDDFISTARILYDFAYYTISLDISGGVYHCDVAIF